MYPFAEKMQRKERFWSQKEPSLIQVSKPCWQHLGMPKYPLRKSQLLVLFATGTELLEVEDPLEPGKIRNSNSHMIMAQIERAGAEVRIYGKLPDELETCYEAISNALSQVDMLITTGGVSVGDFDLLPEIYEKLGAEVLFNKVAMRPGSVTTVAQISGQDYYLAFQEIHLHVMLALNCLLGQ